MPILARETDIYPLDLLDRASEELTSEEHWWAFYTRSRREKQLTRHLLACEIPFYAPVIPRNNRSRGGRVRTSYIPLFQNYVFVYGGETERYQAVTSGYVSQDFLIHDAGQLTSELRQIQRLIEIGCPLTPEAKLASGDAVRVLSGSFQGFEGTVIRREQKTRLLIAVRFTQQGASVLLDDCQLERV